MQKEAREVIKKSIKDIDNILKELDQKDEKQDSAFFSHEEAEKFFKFLRILKISRAEFARRTEQHPVTVAYQVKENRVKRIKCTQFLKDFFKESGVDFILTK